MFQASVCIVVYILKRAIFLFSRYLVEKSSIMVEMSTLLANHSDLIQVGRIFLFHIHNYIIVIHKNKHKVSDLEFIVDFSNGTGVRRNISRWYRRSAKYFYMVPTSAGDNSYVPECLVQCLESPILFLTLARFPSRLLNFSSNEFCS